MKIILFLLLFGLIGFVQADILQTDKSQIINNLDNLVTAVNAGDIEIISSLVRNSLLEKEIQEKIQGGFHYQLIYLPINESLEVINKDKVKINSRFSASGPGWDVSGLSTYFVFEKINNQWFITETDFHEKIGSDYVFSLIKKFFTIFALIFIPLFIFWLWMFVDCLKRDFKDKTLWIVILLFVSFLGAILYFFLVKKKNIRKKTLLIIFSLIIVIIVVFLVGKNYNWQFFGALKEEAKELKNEIEEITFEIPKEHDFPIISTATLIKTEFIPPCDIPAWLSYCDVDVYTYEMELDINGMDKWLLEEAKKLGWKNCFSDRIKSIGEIIIEGFQTECKKGEIAYALKAKKNNDIMRFNLFVPRGADLY